MSHAKVVVVPLVIAVIFAAAFGPARAQSQPADDGKRDFESSCAVCHGAGGKGDGSYAIFHQLRIPDLTALSARNRDVFPFERVAEIIDGRGVTLIHGRPGMPMWGDRYKVKAAADCVETRCDPEPVVKARVRALTEYIRQLNSK